MNSLLHGSKNVGSDHAMWLRTDLHRCTEEKNSRSDRNVVFILKNANAKPTFFYYYYWAWHLKHYFNLVSAHRAKKKKCVKAFQINRFSENQDEMEYIGGRLERVHKLRDVYNSEECLSQHGLVKWRKNWQRSHSSKKKHEVLYKVINLADFFFLSNPSI